MKLGLAQPIGDRDSAVTARIPPERSAAASPMPVQDDLRRRLRRADRRREIKALALTLPALLFLAAALIVPLAFFMSRAVDNSDMVDHLPRLSQAIGQWDGNGLPPDGIQAVLMEELKTLRGTPALAILARRLNYHEAGYRSLIQKTANGLAGAQAGPPSDVLKSIDARWGEPQIWQTLRQESASWTPFFMLAALDLQRDGSGAITAVSSERAIYQRVFLRTLLASLAVTALCLVLGYATAYALLQLKPGTGRLCLLVVLISLWTSLLVRTLAWIIILQKNGMLNSALTGAGLIDEPIQFIRTWFAVILAMVHLLLPLMILPILSVMRGIRPSYMRAARSLGATPAHAFRTVYLPMTLPGIGAGVVLVSTASLGFFVTPELLGGPEHQMVSYFVAFFTNMSVNWGLASALGTWLFVFTLALFAITYRAFGITRVKA